MRKISLFLLTSIISLFLLTPQPGSAQMMFQSSPSANAGNVSLTKQDELAGQNIYNDLISGKTTCDKLSDDDFEKLGEYFMGQSIRNAERHTVMNQMIKNMMGDQGESQMHITMGKRFSGCDTSVPYLQNGWSFMPMMWMMGSTGSPQVEGGGNPMMGYGGWGNMMGWGFGILGWLTMAVFWILLVLGVITLIRYLSRSEKGTAKEGSSLNILKERYAKGEIDKKEFEEKKKDLI